MSITPSKALALLAMSLPLAVRAQTVAATTPTGLLGQRYAEINAGATDPSGISDRGLTAGTFVNIPVHRNIDVAFGYDYYRLNAHLSSGLFVVRTQSQTLFSSATFFTNFRGSRPFVDATLGYSWTQYSYSFGGTPIGDQRDTQTIWSLGTGIELALRRVTLTPRISRRGNFARKTVFTQKNAYSLSYGAEAHLWFTPTIGGFAGVVYFDPHGIGFQGWSYDAGARFRF